MLCTVFGKLQLHKHNIIWLFNFCIKQWGFLLLFTILSIQATSFILYQGFELLIYYVFCNNRMSKTIAIQHHVALPVTESVEHVSDGKPRCATETGHRYLTSPLLPQTGGTQQSSIHNRSKIQGNEPTHTFTFMTALYPAPV